MKTRTIWKFPFETTDQFTLSMPKGAQILSVQTQMRTPCIWALVDPKAPVTKRIFSVYGTGSPITFTEELSYTYIGTYQLHNGALVFHLFEWG